MKQFHVCVLTIISIGNVCETLNHLAVHQSCWNKSDDITIKADDITICDKIPQ